MNFRGVIFDLDGVITKTARVHAKAWKKAFDDYLRLREKRDGEPFREFTHEGDYLPYVDGKPRYDGVRSFLLSRGIDIPLGDPSDPPEAETICGIGNRKNANFRSVLAGEGAEVFESSVALIRELKENGIHVGVASSSKNCLDILRNAGLEGLFETRVDGLVSVELKLKGKPEGDIFTTAARNMRVSPAESVVVEDAVSGVAAGRNGGFGLVLGLDREGTPEDLLANGADLVVRDLSEITLAQIDRWFERVPDDLGPEGDGFLMGRARPVVFLDYDGTLTPIVRRPELAVLSPEMRAAVLALSKKCTVAVVSGRRLPEVRDLVGIDGLVYAGSHGFDIAGPGFEMIHPGAEAALPAIERAAAAMKASLNGVPGTWIEEKRFSAVLHYREADEAAHLGAIEKAAREGTASAPGLRLARGKKVFEILPDIDWDKGRAVRWILEKLGTSFSDSQVVFFGDDTTDEDAFRMIRTRGTGVLIAQAPRPSAASLRVASPGDLRRLLEKLAQR